MGEADGAVVGALLKAKTLLSSLDLSGSSCAPEALARILEGLRASAAPLAELRLGSQAVGEAEGAVVGALLNASTSLSTLNLSSSSCAAEAARLIGEGLRESALGGCVCVEVHALIPPRSSVHRAPSRARPGACAQQSVRFDAPSGCLCSSQSARVPSESPEVPESEAAPAPPRAHALLNRSASSPRACSAHTGTTSV